MSCRLQRDAGETMLKQFLSETEWGGYYFRFLGNDFKDYIHSHGYPGAKNPWPKGRMKEWCESVGGLEVVGSGSTETVQLCHNWPRSRHRENVPRTIGSQSCRQHVRQHADVNEQRAAKVLTLCWRTFTEDEKIASVVAFGSERTKRQTVVALVATDWFENWFRLDPQLILLYVSMLRLTNDIDTATRNTWVMELAKLCEKLTYHPFAVMACVQSLTVLASRQDEMVVDCLVACLCNAVGWLRSTHLDGPNVSMHKLIISIVEALELFVVKGDERLIKSFGDKFMISSLLMMPLVHVARAVLVIAHVDDEQIIGTLVDTLKAYRGRNHEMCAETLGVLSYVSEHEDVVAVVMPYRPKEHATICWGWSVRRACPERVLPTVLDEDVKRVIELFS